MINWEEVASKTSINKLEWRFIPPQAPWWGVFWERMVGLVKNLIRRMLGKASLTQCRKLKTTLSFHVCKGNESSLNLLDSKDLPVRWQYIQKLAKDLRVRFRNEYLSALVERKSNDTCRILNIGDIVLIGSDGSKRVNWPLGRVLEIYEGSDGLCRIARVKTANGVLVRPLQRLYPIVVSASCEQESTQPGTGGEPCTVPQCQTETSRVSRSSESCGDVAYQVAVNEQSEEDAIVDLRADHSFTTPSGSAQPFLGEGSQDTGSEQTSSVPSAIAEHLALGFQITQHHLKQQFALREANYKRAQEREEEVHRLKIAKKEFLVKAAEENSKKAVVERQNAEEEMERSMLNLKKIQKIRRANIRSKTKALDAFTHAQKLKWKLKDQRWAITVTKWKRPQGKRRKGKPHTR
ncbi:hypothetical protein evm_006799 [Chilo suppressalis]|nr:hypothetical protein evm_006799 [Chilo suppressalis]